MKRFISWRFIERLAWVMSIATCLFVAGFFIAYWLALSTGAAGNASALVQAVGSVAAIFVAIKVSSSQREHEQKLRNENRLEEERGLASRLKFIAKEVTNITDRIPLEELEKEGRLDPQSMLVLSGLQQRLNALDSDLNHNRIELAHQLRTTLTELIYFLHNYDGIQGAADLVAERQKSLAVLRRISVKHSNLVHDGHV